MNLYEVVKLLGMVLGAGLLGLALRPYSAERLVLVVLILALLAIVLSVLATIGQEPRSERLREAAEQTRAGAFLAALSSAVPVPARGSAPAQR